MFEKI
jgi:hypothetical protein